MRALDVRVERLVPSSDQRGSVELPTHGTCIGEDVLETILREDVPLALLLDHDVRGLWGNRQPRVGDQGPGRGRPPEQVRPDESIVLGLHDRELDEDARVLDVRVAHRDLGVGQRRPATRTVGRDAIVLEQEPPSVQLLERPPHALDVLRVHRPVRVVGVDPEPESLGLPLELTDVAPDGFPAQAVELGDPERLDVALALGADLLLDLELDREPVAVPPRLARDVVTRHRPEPGVDVLEGPRLRVVDRRLSVRGRRPLVEGPQRAVPPLVELAVEHVGLAPELEHPPLELGEVRLRVHRLEHLHLPHAKRLVPLVQGRGANPAVPPRVAGTLTVPAAHRLPEQPTAVTGGPGRVYCGRAARARFGRRLEEDVRRGLAAGLTPSPARSGSGSLVLVPVIACHEGCYTRRWGWSRCGWDRGRAGRRSGSTPVGSWSGSGPPPSTAGPPRRLGERWPRRSACPEPGSACGAAGAPGPRCSRSRVSISGRPRCAFAQRGRLIAALSRRC